VTPWWTFLGLAVSLPQPIWAFRSSVPFAYRP
jgi:hypothetical protein